MIDSRKLLDSLQQLRHRARKIANYYSFARLFVGAPQPRPNL